MWIDLTARWQNGLDQKAKQYQDAAKTYYPALPDPPLAPTLPLLNYTGTYYHPAYHNITVELKDDALFLNRSDATVSVFFWGVSFRM